MVHFISITEKTLAESLARLFRDNVWKLHGLPESIISDRGPQFMAGLMKKLNQMLGIKSKLLIAFCHKLHSAISPSILHRFSQSQWLRKALEKTFRSVPVTSRGDQ